MHGFFATSSLLPAPLSERHVPALEVPLFFNFGEVHRYTDGTRDGVWVVGLHDRHRLTEAVGERRFMVVRFTPMGAHLFLGLPMHTIVNEAVDLHAIDPALARQLWSRVGVARSWADRFAAMESLIAERIGGAESPVGIAWKKLLASDGRIALTSLASDMQCSYRTFIARFRSSIGLPPKTIARLMRFNRVVRSIDRRGSDSVGKPYIESTGESVPIPWADVAADCGYFDQAHLIREFREFAGSTPGAFMRQVSSIK